MLIPRLCDSRVSLALLLELRLLPRSSRKNILCCAYSLHCPYWPL